MITSPLVLLAACAPPSVVYRPAAEAIAMAHPPFVDQMRDGSSIDARASRAPSGG